MIMQFIIIDGSQATNDPVSEETISAFEEGGVEYLPCLAFHFEDTKRRPCRPPVPMASRRTETCAVLAGNSAERAVNAQSCKTCALSSTASRPSPAPCSWCSGPARRST